MCLLFLAIGLGVLGLGIFLYETQDMYNTGVFLGVIGGLLAGAFFIALCFLVPMSAASSTVDDRIEMYQEENAKIEEQIATIVEQYQEYEKDIFTEVAPESAMTLVMLYPELKSDTLVSSQIDIYVKNNEKLKELKEEKINASVVHWWTYFGN
jgi:hypothetical protein